VYVQFRDDWRARWKEGLTVSLVIASIWVLGAVGWNFFWGPKGGGPQILVQQWTTHSLFQVFTNVVGLFGSPTKGLFVFAPALLVAVYALPRVYRTYRELAVFALLVTVCISALLSILIVTADELWGPRFLHVAIAPLLVVIGAACPRFRMSTLAPIILLGG